MNGVQESETGRNTVSKSVNGVTTSYSYNNFNQQISVTSDGKTAQYAYNTQGIRTVKAVDGSVTKFYLDGGNVVGETTGTQTVSYLRGLNLIHNGSSYYLFNVHADVVNLTNSSGSVTKTYFYDAFGVEKNPSETDTNHFRYCGEYWDAETETYYLRARYYDPALGRFTQQDTHWNTANMIYGDIPQMINEREDRLGLKSYSFAPQITSIIQSSNLYVYAVSNPVDFVDLNGKFIISTAALLIGGGALLFGTVGGFIGNHIANEKGAIGRGKVGYIAGGVAIGGICGAALGAGGAHLATLAGLNGISISSVGIAAVYSAPIGTLGQTLLDSWQQAENSLRNAIGSVSNYSERVFSTPYGNRIADAYNSNKDIIAEAKYGYKTLTEFIKQQILKDSYLLETGAVKHVEWHFYISQQTGKGGASASLIKELLEHGIKVVYH